MNLDELAARMRPPMSIPPLDTLHIRHYQNMAIVTAASYPTKRFTHCMFAVALAGEMGELFNGLKKWAGHGHAFDAAAVEEEIGDVLWYLVNIAQTDEIVLGKELGHLPPRLVGNVSRDPVEEVLNICLRAQMYCGLLARTHVYGSEIERALNLCYIWYWMHVLAYCLCLDIDDIMHANIARLRARYGEKFSQEASINREG